MEFAHLLIKLGNLFLQLLFLLLRGVLRLLQGRLCLFLLRFQFLDGCHRKKGEYLYDDDPAQNFPISLFAAISAVEWYKLGCKMRRLLFIGSVAALLIVIAVTMRPSGGSLKASITGCTPTDFSVQEISTPATGLSNQNQIHDMVTGPDGNLWYITPGPPQLTQNGDYEQLQPAKVVKMTPDGHTTDYPLPSSVKGDIGNKITVGPDGNLWTTEPLGKKLVRITPSGGITEFPTAASNVDHITKGPDGNLWFSGEYDKPLWQGAQTLDYNVIAKSTAAGVITEFKNYVAADFVAGADGNLWFTNATGVSKRSSTNGTITNYALSGGATTTSSKLIVGSDGNLWTVVSITGLSQGLAKIKMDGTSTIYPFPDQMVPNGFLSFPGIAIGADGNIWTTEESWGNSAMQYQTSLKIQQTTPAGVTTQYPLTSSGAFVITSGPDGNLWFAQIADKDIAKFSCTPASSSSVSVIIPSSVPPESSSAQVQGDDMTCQSILGPDTVTAGSPFRETVNVQNTGTTAWVPKDVTGLDTSDPRNEQVYGVSAHNYYLYDVDWKNSNYTVSNWGISVRLLPSNNPVPAGQISWFILDMTAPSQPGDYSFDWQMVHSGTGYFGQTCSKTISVLPAVASAKSIGSSAPSSVSSSVVATSSAASVQSSSVALSSSSQAATSLSPSSSSSSSSSRSSSAAATSHPSSSSSKPAVSSLSSRSASSISTPYMVCGDGKIEWVEKCDDGNDRPGDGCSDTCWIEAGWVCAGTPSQCIRTPVPSSAPLSSSASARMSSAAALMMTASSSTKAATPAHTSSAVAAVVAPPPQPPAAALHSSSSAMPFVPPPAAVSQTDTSKTASSSVAMTTMLTVPSVSSSAQPVLKVSQAGCGNGILEPGETCDRGTENSMLPNALCRPDCSPARCGDGIVDTRNEQCDAGAGNSDQPGAACSSTCHLPSTQTLAKQTGTQPIVLNPSAPLQPLQPATLYQGAPQQITAALLPPLPQIPHAPVGATGPGSLAAMAAGAATGIGWVRRKRRS